MTKPPLSEDDWRALRAVHGYRWALAVALGVVYIAGWAQPLFEVRQTQFFAAACLCYLLLCLPAAAAVYLRRPGLTAQVFLLTGVDIVFVAALVAASGGVDGGLAVLLVLPVAGAAMFLRRHNALLLAAIASIALLAEEAWRTLYGADVAEWVSAGLFGLLLFLTTALANVLAWRARSSAALAARRQTEVLDLTALNERIVRHLVLGLVVVDDHNRIRLLNPAAQTMLDLGMDAVGRGLAAAAPELGRACAAWLDSPALAPEPVEMGRINLLPRFARLGPGAHALVLIFLEDSRSLDEAAQQIKLASLGRLSASIAHEIRNPLSAIHQAAQLLDEAAGLEEEDRRLLAIVHRHCRRIDSLVEDVLGLGRRSRSQPTRIDLPGWLPKAVQDYRSSRSETPRIEVTTLPRGLTVHADADQLRQILVNLLDNAERHGAAPDRDLVIRIAAGRSAVGAPWIEVADNGPGFPEDAAKNLMEPFFTTGRDGTGLGLYIARELCACNHARIHAGNSADSGAIFRIIFGHRADLPVTLPENASRSTAAG
ncbi:MAG: ATP-binding protein [Salinisphaera sp.]|nr:ATP-binding protein [Salinisphaera sp.]